MRKKDLKKNRKEKNKFCFNRKKIISTTVYSNRGDNNGGVKIIIGTETLLSTKGTKIEMGWGA